MFSCISDKDLINLYERFVKLILVSDKTEEEKQMDIHLKQVICSECLRRGLGDPSKMEN